MAEEKKALLGEVILHLLLLAFSAGVILLIPHAVPAGNTKGMLGPRTFPYIMAAGMCVMSLLGLWRAVRRREQITRDFIFPVRFFAALALVIFWLAALSRLGFVLCTIILVTGSMYVMGCRNKKLLVIFPVVLSGVLYVAFGILLKVRLPMLLLK